MGVLKKYKLCTLYLRYCPTMYGSKLIHALSMYLTEKLVCNFSFSQQSGKNLRPLQAFWHYTIHFSEKEKENKHYLTYTILQLESKNMSDKNNSPTDCHVITMAKTKYLQKIFSGNMKLAECPRDLYLN